jgi:hypothetical protein
MKHYAGRMTRTYAAKRLLEHGPLTAAQFIEITGWKERTCRRTLQQLLDTKVATIWNPQRLRHATRHYALASLPIADGSQPSTVQRLSAPSAGTTNCFLGWN